jgi:hypothetical protein
MPIKLGLEVGEHCGTMRCRRTRCLDARTLGRLCLDNRTPSSGHQAVLWGGTRPSTRRPHPTPPLVLEGFPALSWFKAKTARLSGPPYEHIWPTRFIRYRQRRNSWVV